MRNSIERPKIRRLRRKGYRKNLQSQSLLVFVVSFTPETPNFGTFDPPSRIYYYFLLFNCVYSHIWNLNCKNILILKKK